MAVVEVENLAITYRVPVRESGLRAAFGSLFHRRFQLVQAVRGISFDLAPGEVVGFIGPNGAGKTSTLKMLSGLLHPTGGSARVMGCIPWRREPGFLRQIAMIRGSRPLGVAGELTVLDALRFQQLIYEVPEPEFKRNLAELADLLHLEPLLQRQARALSLGEKMRAGLAWSLVYRPRILFLDEPTLGLDVSATAMMRRFIAGYSRQTGAAVLLTSHYMADVESLCRRVILIDKGAVAYDGELARLAARLAPYKLLSVAVPERVQPDWSRYGEVVSTEAERVSLRVLRDQVPSATARLLAELPVADLTVTEAPLESVIDQVYREGV
ncbi:MAG: ABC transporter ATP-binding protein [Bacillota bacterium]